MMMGRHCYALILAGGVGTRLWPLSRQNQPKQHLTLFGDSTLLESTYARARTLFPKERIFVVTHAREASRIRRELPQMPQQQLVIEPEKRGTGTAIGFALVHILARDPKALLLTLNSDAWVQDERRFAHALLAAVGLAREHPRELILLGIPALYPETGYGYILAARSRKRTKGFLVARVQGFREKPNRDVAERFVQSKTAYWNPTILVSSGAHLLSRYALHDPKAFRILEEIHSALLRAHAAKTSARVAAFFRRLPQSDINYDILEREKHMMVLVANRIGWTDVGHWRAVDGVWQAGNPLREPGQRVTIHGANNFIFADPKKLVATIGLADFIIVDTPDALLLCPKHRAQEVRDIVRELSDRGLSQYL